MENEKITDLLVAMLLSSKNTKIFRSIINQRKLARYKKESVRVALSRLNKNGYLKNSKEGWSITNKGKIYANRVILLSYIPSPFKEKESSTIIVSFDIPGPKRAVRDWLRNQLKIFNYKMIHQSLWLGPGPLPQKFLKRLVELKIRENIKIFNIKKE